MVCCAVYVSSLSAYFFPSLSVTMFLFALEHNFQQWSKRPEGGGYALNSPLPLVKSIGKMQSLQLRSNTLAGSSLTVVGL